MEKTYTCTIREIYNKIKDTEIEIEDKRSIMKEVTRPTNQIETRNWFILVNGIIYLYAIDNYEDYQKNKIPFKGKRINDKKGIKYHLDNIPDRLINILAELIKITME